MKPTPLHSFQTSTPATSPAQPVDRPGPASTSHSQPAPGQTSTLIPHAGPGTHTLVIAVEIDDAVLIDPSQHHLIIERAHELVCEALADTNGGTTRAQLAAVAIGAIARQHKVLPEEITGRSLSRKITPIRQEAMWMVNRRAGLSLTETGRLFDRDHTTVLHGVRKVEERISEDVQLSSWLERVWQLACGRRSDVWAA